MRVIDKGSSEPKSEMRIERALTRNEATFFKLNQRIAELESLSELSQTPELMIELQQKRSFRDSLNKKAMQSTDASAKPELRTLPKREPEVRRPQSAPPVPALKPEKPTLFGRIKSWFKNPLGI
jgi:hypothetical protein